MAIGGVVIQFITDTGRAVRDFAGVGRAAENAAADIDTMDSALSGVDTELARAGAAARGTGTDLDAAGSGFRELADDVDDTLRRVRQDMDQLGPTVARGASDVDRETSQMRTDMGEVGRETGSEFISNIAEGIGSGSGNLNDVVSGTLGGLTNLTATLTGPVGVAAGIAAGAIGLVWNTMHAQAEKAKERVSELLDLLEEVEDQSEEAARDAIFEAWLEQMKQMPGELRSMVSVMEAAGVEAETFQDAIAGSEEAQDAVRTAIQLTGGAIIRNQQETGELTEEQARYLEDMGLVLSAMDQQNGDLQDAKALHEDLNWLQGEGKRKQKDLTAEVGKTESAWRGVNSAADTATRPRTAKVQVDYQERWVKKPGGSGGPSSGYPHAAAFGPMSTQTVTQIAPAYAGVPFTDEQLFRALYGCLERGYARNGKTWHLR